jgi:hypothetical protein
MKGFILINALAQADNLHRSQNLFKITTSNIGN